VKYVQKELVRNRKPIERNPRESENYLLLSLEVEGEAGERCLA